MKKVLFSALAIFFSAFAYGQWKTTPYIAGLSWNVVENDGDNVQFFKPSETWYYKYYPTRLSIEKMFQLGISVDLAFTYNQYTTGKIINNEINAKIRDYYAIDAKMKYDLNYLFGETAWFDPYVHVGYGYHNTTKVSDLFKDRLTGSTHNLGIGFHLWITKDIALSTETLGKWAFYRRGGNHFQHCVGVVYKFGGLPGRMYTSDTFIKWSQRMIEKIKD
ncbi:MAG: outer membrane beta-barrel protein [Bacteroidia bacterium]|nr:outer membrane beta-barrel protein [Bacteroidia bacterium]